MSIASVVFIIALLVLQAYFRAKAPRWVQLTFWSIWTIFFIILLLWVMFGDMHSCKFLCE